jgi:hypothetical protein
MLHGRQGTSLPQRCLSLAHRSKK